MAEITLFGGNKAIVDDSDYARLSKFKWQSVTYGSSTYARRCERLNGKTKSYFMHHEIFGSGKRLDHIDGNGLNNQMSNLRECTHSQNMWNRRKLSPATSKFKGVQWWKAQKMWAARLTKDRKRIFLGYFNNEIDAAKAYNAAAVQYFGQFSNLNKL